MESLTPRGGVAVYKKIASEFDTTVVSDDFKDCVIFKILPIDVICIAMYIPPSSSKYFTSEYLDNMQLFLSNFKLLPMCLMGDLNTRFGQPPIFNRDISYKNNPDKELNANGRALIRILKEEKSFHIVNGMQTRSFEFDTDYTFFRGETYSQNDVTLVNNIELITSFKIKEKNPYSDHKPLAITLTAKPKAPLEFVADCALDTFKYDCYDINKKILKAVKLSKLDVPCCIEAMDIAAAELNEVLDLGTLTNNDVCTRITNVIYSTCKANRRRADEADIPPTLQNQNCTSRHYYAIAEANFNRYQQLLLEERNAEEYLPYLNTWIEAENLAKVHKEEEFNTRVNESWNHCNMKDGRSIWNAIDWKGKSVKQKKDEIPADVIQSYFRGIFQSPKTRNNPTLVKGETYQCEWVEELDHDITMEELNDAMNEIGTGTSLDGIAPDVLKIIPTSLRRHILDLFNKIFSTSYPEAWHDQLLFPYPKKGHKVSNPQLRGIAIGALLSRVYDKILNKRFLTWYEPNKEQAGFRKFMGCLLQIFCIYLLMEYARENGKEIFAAFMDYEKAFDFLNRKRLMEKLHQRNAGQRFITAIHSMYETTAYVPKLSQTRLGDRITTEHGVTQGKESSANLYSFYVSDMPSYLEHYRMDFMDPLNLAQLADDTVTLASLTNSLCLKIRSLFGYSDDNFQIANIGKTKYLHLSCNPITEPLQIDEEQYVESAHHKGYTYLGMLFICSNRMSDQMLANINGRMGNMHKFYAWLQYNNLTPIKIKLLALYNCVFSAILYGAETWGDLTSISEKILKVERQALKRILGVKSSTPSNLIYIELDRADIVAVTQDRQHNFITKLLSLEEDSAIVLKVLELCKDLTIVRYYQNIRDDNRKSNMGEKLDCANTATETHTKRYKEFTNLQHCNAIYDTFMREDLRIVITRWRLSCFDLAIETGRYNGTAREDRLCSFCDVIEDEHHAIFQCTAYDTIREEFKNLLQENPTVKKILNPTNKEMAEKVGKYLKLIENRRKELI